MDEAERRAMSDHFNAIIERGRKVADMVERQIAADTKKKRKATDNA
jgi:hypothetical protein